MLDDAALTERLYARIAALETLQDVARDLTAELDLTTLLEKILRAARQVSHSTAGTLFLYDPTTHELVFKVVIGGGGDALKEKRLPADRGIAGESFLQQRPLLVNNTADDPRFFSEPATSVGFEIYSLLAAPLIAQGKAIGVLEVMNKEAREAYTQEDAELLMAFASQSAIAIENARLYSESLLERDRILAAEAAVRHELARDLHDGPTQMLSALIMEIRLMREYAEQDMPRLMKEFVNLEAVAQKALYQTRNILFDLRPVVLEQQGLAPALEQYVMRLRMVEPYRITLRLDSMRTRFEYKTEAAIFSIIQEAVNNVKAHAGASQLRIDAVETERELSVTVQDDGCGFDVAEVRRTYARRGAMGLLNMQERAEIARGKLTIESESNVGTQVKLVVPLIV